VKVGVPTEVKNREYRVALTPAGVHELVTLGHEVLVQAGAGLGSSLPDDDFAAAGARIVAGPTDEQAADDVWAEAELVLKVKEPVAQEYHRLRKDQVVFTYLHLAASRECTDALLQSGTTAIAYETVQLPDRSLPLLAPMSEVAGRLAPQVGAYHLMRAAGGRGVLMGGVPGVPGADVVVIGGGVSGQNAAAIALGMGAEVTLLDLSIPKLREVDARFAGRVRTVTSNAFELDRLVTSADLVIGAVLVPGARAPKLVSNELVSRMRPGSVLVDIAIDQGGCFADSRPTTHDDPTYAVHDTVFYCVANMPGAVPHTSTYALTNATLPYVVALVQKGWRDALRADPALAHGLSTHEGQLTSEEVGQAHGIDVVEPATLLA
jgi:alanine dehydrogenase